MLPCGCSEEEWKTLEALFKENLHIEKNTGFGTLEGQLTVRTDGMAILEGNINREFKFSRSGVQALKYWQQLQKAKCSNKEIITKISEKFGVSRYQVEAFMNLKEKWIGNADCKFIEIGTDVTPLLVQWDITSTCNLQCVHCYMDATAKHVENELTLKEIFTFIKELSDCGVRSIHLLGGEPFIHPDILEIIQAILKKGMYCYISTNGTLLNEELVKDLSNLKRITVDVSLDGVCPRAHDSFRGVKGTFQRVLNGLALLKEYNISHNVTAVLGKHNFNEIEEIIELALQYEAKRIQFLTFSPTGRGAQAIAKFGFTKKQLKIVRKKIIDLILKYQDQIYIDAPLIGCSLLALRVWEILAYQGYEMYYEVSTGCDAGVTKIAIDPFGNVMLCPQARQGFGNIRSLPFLTIWKTIQTYCQTHKNCPDQKCKFFNVCGGKCRI